MLFCDLGCVRGTRDRPKGRPVPSPEVRKLSLGCPGAVSWLVRASLSRPSLSRGLSPWLSLEGVSGTGAVPEVPDLFPDLM